MSFAPSLKLTEEQMMSHDPLSLSGGQCLTSSYSMLFNCDNSAKDHIRLCPCLMNQKEPIVDSSSGSVFMGEPKEDSSL